MATKYDYKLIDELTLNGTKLIDLCKNYGWDYDSVKNGLYRHRKKMNEKVITISQIISDANKEKKKDPDNKEYHTLIIRMKGRDQYLFRSFLKLVNKRIK